MLNGPTTTIVGAIVVLVAIYAVDFASKESSDAIDRASNLDTIDMGRSLNGVHVAFCTS